MLSCRYSRWKDGNDIHLEQHAALGGLPSFCVCYAATLCFRWRSHYDLSAIMWHSEIHVTTVTTVKICEVFAQTFTVKSTEMHGAFEIAAFCGLGASLGGYSGFACFLLWLFVPQRWAADFLSFHAFASVWPWWSWLWPCLKTICLKRTPLSARRRCNSCNSCNSCELEQWWMAESSLQLIVALLSMRNGGGKRVQRRRLLGKWWPRQMDTGMQVLRFRCLRLHLLLRHHLWARVVVAVATHFSSSLISSIQQRPQLQRLRLPTPLRLSLKDCDEWVETSRFGRPILRQFSPTHVGVISKRVCTQKIGMLQFEKSAVAEFVIANLQEEPN